MTDVRVPTHVTTGKHLPMFSEWPPNREHGELTSARKGTPVIVDFTFPRKPGREPLRIVHALIGEQVWYGAAHDHELTPIDQQEATSD